MTDKRKDEMFICGIGARDDHPLPQIISVCPAYGADWSQLYIRADRAASTPDAGLVSDKYHRHHEIHEGICVTCYTMQGEIDKLREALKRIAVPSQEEK